MQVQWFHLCFGFPSGHCRTSASNFLRLRSKINIRCPGFPVLASRHLCTRHHKDPWIRTNPSPCRIISPPPALRNTYVNGYMLSSWKGWNSAELMRPMSSCKRRYRMRSGDGASSGFVMEQLLSVTRRSKNNDSLAFMLRPLQKERPVNSTNVLKPNRN